MKAAIFDLDGTLVDSMGVWEKVDRSFLSKHGFAYDAYYTQKLKDMNYKQAAEFTIAYLHLDTTPEQLMDEWDAMAIWEYAHSVPLKPGAEALLYKLHAQGIPILLATVSTPRLYRAVLSHYHLLDLFCFITSPEMAHKGKDGPDLYLEAASFVGCEPKDCIVFEDILKGLKAAKQAGFITCAVEDESQMQDRAAIRETADYFVRDLAEADQLLFSSN